MTRLGHIAAFALLGASALLVAPPAAAEDEETPLPYPDPLPPRRPRARFEMNAAVGWMHGSIYDVPIDMGDAQIGFGAIFPPNAGGISFGLNGTVSMQYGRTQAGRALSGADVGVEAMLHWRWLRAGAGLRLGMLEAQRSTRNDTESTALADGYLALGVEPFRVDETPFFLEGRLHVSTLGDGGSAFWLGAGFRFCTHGCPR